MKSERVCWLCGRPRSEHKETPFGPICPKNQPETFFRITGKEALYDLSSGYGGADKIGTYDGQIPIYSAEGFLCAIEKECENNRTATVSTVIAFPQKIARGRNYL